MENRGEITSFIFSYISQNPCRRILQKILAKKLQRKYNTVAIAQNGKTVFHSEDMAYKIW